MTETNDYLFGRRASLMLTSADNVLDLSELRFRFRVESDDEESPNNAMIRVYNLNPATVTNVRKEFDQVILQAGYGDNFGVIFKGNIRQFRIGREGTTDTYLDLLCADGDEAYNFAMMHDTLGRGSSNEQRVRAAIAAMGAYGVTPGDLQIPSTGGILPRGKVLFGLARASIRMTAQSIGATWSIQDGKVQVTPLTGYLPGEAVVLNGQTGLVGRPEQTQNGIQAKCLINPRIQVGGLVQIDNRSINQTLNQDPWGAMVPYNQWAGLQMMADLQADGLYRVYVIEYEGDTRGQPYYAELTLLSIDPVTMTCKAYG